VCAHNISKDYGHAARPSGLAQVQHAIRDQNDPAHILLCSPLLLGQDHRHTVFEFGFAASGFAPSGALPLVDQHRYHFAGTVTLNTHDFGQSAALTNPMLSDAATDH
jgi:hypothetical protein